MIQIIDSVRDCKLLFNSAVQNESAMILLRSKLSAISTRLGFSDLKRENVALVASEIVSNQIKYAGSKGMIQIWQQPGPILDIFALDFGPGIQNLSEAQADGFSTANTLGKGLGSIRRLSDHAFIYSQSAGHGLVKRWNGTGVLARFVPLTTSKTAPLARREPPYQIGLYSRPLSDDRFNGDRVYLLGDGDMLRWLHLDGLGHGKEAEETTANLSALLPRCANPEALLKAVDKQLRNTRGSVGIAAEFGVSRKILEIAGVGDMHAHFFANDQLRNFSFAPGILGKDHKDIGGNTQQIERQCIALTASDGIRKNLDSANFPGLFNSHPQLIAYMLGNIMARISDDQSLCVVSMNP